MDLQIIVSGALKTPWVAGIRLQKLKKFEIQKCQLGPLIEEIKSKQFSLKFLGILLFGLCSLIVKLHEYIEEDLGKILKSSSETPQKNRSSDISAQTVAGTIRGILKYSGERLSALIATPPSLEKLRRELVMRGEDITLAEYKGKDEEIIRDSLGMNEFLDTNLYQDSFSLALPFENLAEVHTPQLSPHLLRLSEHNTERKAKKRGLVDQNTIYKNVNREIDKKDHEMCGEKVENALVLPEELNEMIRHFSGTEVQEFHQITQNAEVNEVLVEEHEFQVNEEVEKQDGSGSVGLTLQIDYEGNDDFVRDITPLKSMQTVAFEEILKNELKKTKHCRFAELVNGYSRCAAAKAFCSLLVLAKTSELCIDQRHSFGDIRISI